MQLHKGKCTELFGKAVYVIRVYSVEKKIKDVRYVQCYEISLKGNFIEMFSKLSYTYVIV